LKKFPNSSSVQHQPFELLQSFVAVRSRYIPMDIREE